MLITDLTKGYDNQTHCYTISLKINGVIFETTAFSETERDNIYDRLNSELKSVTLL